MNDDQNEQPSPGIQSTSPSNPLAFTPETDAAANWARYMYGRTRGHDDYCLQAKMLEGMYLGGGLQWSEEDKEALLEQGRILHEFNEIAPAVNSAIGYQIHNRMDIAFKPRSGLADETIASVRSKIAMQIADMNMLHWKETDMYTDALIEQRGYYDIRINYDNNILGELAIYILDNRDVIPDPDAKSYDPDNWNDVTVTRWMSLDVIEDFFGKDIRLQVEASRPTQADFGVDDASGERNKFGDNRYLNGYSDYDAWRDDSGLVQVRVIDRQKHYWTMADVGIYPTGDIRKIDLDKTDPNTLAAEGIVVTQRRIKLTQRIISTQNCLLYKGDGDFPFFSVIPFFPYFRRGKTRGLVDNGVSPQQAYNKLISQYIHIINSTANSGWVVEQNSLTNMTTEELEETGAVTGIVLEYKQGSNKPDKVNPNQIPTGVDKMIERSLGAVRDATIPEAMRGLNDADNLSGVAKQTDQFASQQQLAIVLDNLARTRYLLAKAIDWCITNIYDSKRVYRITGTDPLTGRESSEEVIINQPQPDGTYLNDMTVGEYDVVISEQPMQITFDNAQFNQVMEMRDKGVAIDDKTVVRYSSLAEKHDIIDGLIKKEQSSGQLNPLDQAKVDFIKAQTQTELKKPDKIVADTAGINVKTEFEAITTGTQVLLNPNVVPVGDAILASGGFKDHNGQPMTTYPAPEQVGGQTIPYQPSAPRHPDVINDVPENTHPMFPPNPQGDGEPTLNGPAQAMPTIQPMPSAVPGMTALNHPQ